MTIRRISVPLPIFLLLAALLAGSGAVAAYLAGERIRQAPQGRQNARTTDSAPASAALPAPPAAVPTVLMPDVTVGVSPELALRAGIEVEPVRTGAASHRLRVPGLVEPDAYREVVVTPLVGGRVTRVLAALGARVRRGQTLAEVYSPELSQARTAYVSAHAEFDAAHQKLQRTERLVTIGAASRQELEQIQAEHARHEAAVREARARLVLLGVEDEGATTPFQTTATISVRAPLAGVVTTRQANVGAAVEPSTGLFTVVDLSTVWVIGNVYERDFARVRVGNAVSITAPALPDRTWNGQVRYIDPQVAPETRTVRVRVEVPNRDEQLRLGMYVDATLATVDGYNGGLVVSRESVQAIGDRHFVYLPEPGQPGRFIERAVRLGRSADDGIEVLEGLTEGDVVVTQGSFLLRAERERLGLRAGADRPGNAGATHPGSATVVRHEIAVTSHGFSPERVEVTRGTGLRLVFVRRTDQTCATEVVIPALSLKRPLPLNTPVTIDYTPHKTGEIAFTCGMNMVRGTLVVR